MKSRLLFSVLAFLLAAATVLTINSCKKGINEEPDPEPNPEVPETTMVIDKETWETNFLEMDSSTYTLYFDKNFSSEAPLEVGDIVISSEGLGLLRKVNKISEVDGKLKIETEFASLTDAVNEGSLHLNTTLSPNKIDQVIYHKEGIALDTSSLKNNKDSQMDYDIDAHFGADDKIHVQGNFSLFTDLTSDIDIGYIPPKIYFFEILYNVEQSLELAVDVKLLNVNHLEEYDLASIYFQPVLATISGVPVLVVPKLKIAVGVKTNAGCDTYSEIDQTLNYSAGLRYENQNWTKINDFDKTFNYLPPNIDCNASIKAYIRPQVSVLIYKVVGPYIFAELYGRIEANPNNIPKWRLFAGAGIGLGVEAEILGAGIFDYRTDPPLINFEELIAFAQEDNNPPVSIFTVNPGSGNTNTVFAFDASDSYDNEDPTSDLQVRWDFDGDGSWDAGWDYDKTENHQYSAEGTYTAKMEVKDTEGLTDYTTQTVTVENGGGSGTFTDPRDGQEYEYVEIGSQTWMAENLNYETANSWWYDNNSTNGDIYGRLYTWDAALNACPSGWHLPSDEEWKTLEMALGMSQNEADGTNLRGTDEGKKMKSTSGWDNNGNGTNSSGFNALPGGARNGNGEFNNMRLYGVWWSATEWSATKVRGSGAWHRQLVYNYDMVGRGVYPKSGGFSVRCLKN
ncbi:MAG: hypothetical protein K9J24_15990 [Bacteroidales bacterium]|nr:hypothetical protein [Bacteroidales bacterium]